MKRLLFAVLFFLAGFSLARYDTEYGYINGKWFAITGPGKHDAIRFYIGLD